MAQSYNSTTTSPVSSLGFGPDHYFVEPNVNNDPFPSNLVLRYNNRGEIAYYIARVGARTGIGYIDQTAGNRGGNYQLTSTSSPLALNQSNHVSIEICTDATYLVRPNLRGDPFPCTLTLRFSCPEFAYYIARPRTMIGGGGAREGWIQRSTTPEEPLEEA